MGSGVIAAKIARLMVIVLFLILLGVNAIQLAAIASGWRSPFLVAFGDSMEPAIHAYDLMIMVHVHDSVNDQFPFKNPEIIGHYIPRFDVVRIHMDHDH